MGICLDTERNSKNGSQEFEPRGREAWLNQENDFRKKDSPLESNLSHHPEGYVNFEVPKVPVIFVLGGPGSGKVTHCDSLTQEKRGVVHINMTDLLQQYSVSDSAETNDFSRLLSRTVTEVLMLEMKMAPAAKTYLISGYPRNMRDLVEYQNKIETISGVILVSWRQKVLERQIEYGAKLGHVVLGLARMELTNFYTNVIPVVDYFDQRQMLTMINGERNPTEVYEDFRSAVLKIMGKQQQATAHERILPNGEPGAVSEPKHPDTHKTTSVSVYSSPAKPNRPSTNKRIQPIIWIVGGPGSNKYTLCQKATQKAPGWTHISVGHLLRSIAETSDATQVPDYDKIRRSISKGELVSSEEIMKLVEKEIRNQSNAKGIVLDGFPRNLSQLRDFEITFKQRPLLILLDCSKLQLGRGRVDDSVAAFRRRLELFREHTLPVLKSLDTSKRMIIIDGDTDTEPVQNQFTEILLTKMKDVLMAAENDSPTHVTKTQVQVNVDVHDSEHNEFGGVVSPPRSPVKVQMNGYGPPRDVGLKDRKLKQGDRFQGSR